MALKQLSKNKPPTEVSSQAATARCLG